MVSLMSLNRSQPGRYGRKQRGATLIVALIMLLLLTLVGVAGLRDTLLQEKMVASMRDRDLALQAAEAALRAAEKDVEGTALVYNNTNGVYDLSPGCKLPSKVPAAGFVDPLPRVVSSTPVAEQKFWQSYDWVTASKSKSYIQTLPGVPFPRYVIEKLPECLSDLSIYPGSGAYAAGSGLVAEADALDLCEGCTNSLIKSDYRITARGQGFSTDTVVILQSTFRRAN